MSKEVSHYFEDLSGNLYTKDNKGRINLVSDLKEYESKERSIVTFSGKRVHYLRGKIHREDAGAVEYPDGSFEYWENGVQFKTVVPEKLELVVTEPFEYSGISMSFFAFQAFLAK